MKKKKPTTYFGVANINALLEYPHHEHAGMLFTRVWAMPNAWTFKIKPIELLLKRYIPAGGEGWIDPYAGYNSPAEYTNDLDPNAVADFHIDAIEFADIMKEISKPDPKWGKDDKQDLFNGILYDPPYSFRQISEHYKHLGRKVTQKDTSMAFYEKTKSAFCELIKPGGYAISFGWNSNGFGKARGFKIVEILMVAHGGSKHDTIVVVEQKV